jgi:hypothetical protein
MVGHDCRVRALPDGTRAAVADLLSRLVPPFRARSKDVCICLESYVAY